MKSGQVKMAGINIKKEVYNYSNTIKINLNITLKGMGTQKKRFQHFFLAYFM